MEKYSDRSSNPASREAMHTAAERQVETAWDRNEKQGPVCGFGELGICCRICEMGPCRVDPFGEGAQTGICGADADTIVARHLIRQVAAGSAAHSDHGFDIAHTLQITAEGKAEGYKIKSEDKLKAIAQEWGIKTEGKKIEVLAKEVADKALAQWGQVQGEIPYMLTRAPKETVDNWRKHGLMPVGIEHHIVQTLHRTHEGVDADYRNLMMHALKTSLSDGWGGSMIGTDLSDVLFGSPMPVRSQANLGVLEEKKVNIVVHGHEPTLSEMIVEASRDKELLELAKKNGAEGIMVGGICCTSNEILMRQGAPVVGNFLSQELAIATGAVDAMVVDVQCIMPALATSSKRFHTKLITTSYKAKINGVEHIQFDEAKAYTIAKEIVRRAVENYPKRGETKIPKMKMDLVAGFTVENTFWHLGGKYRSSFRPLNDAIISGRLRGVAAVIGCNTVKKVQDKHHLAMVKELLKNDVLVVQTGCGAIACAKEGLLTPEAALEYAGEGLKEICSATGLPPVLHLGSCVDNSRILVALCEMIREGGLGTKLSDLPIAGSAPEQMCEKAIAIGFYCVASGAYVNFSPAMRVLGSPNVNKFLTEEVEEITGGKFDWEGDPVLAARKMIAHMDKKRAALKLKQPMYPQPYVSAA